MTILEEIAQKAMIRVREQKKTIPLETMKQLALACVIQENGDIFEKALRKEGLSFICEVKKASPSKGLISSTFPYLEIAKDYEAAGASAISVLTEPDYFQGKNVYLTEISKTVSLPILRKDFTVDAYQIYEAKVIGASAILLICSILTDQQLLEYRQLAESLHLAALVEVHDEEEVKRALQAGVSILGVNNRNLKTFQVDMHNSIRLRNKVPSDILFVSESGIRTEEDVKELVANGVDGVLIGEAMMTSSNRRRKLTEFIQSSRS
ncbi:indole-3-glycerol phosphate synthase TrpC [Anaerosporobacter faecicola]|uniref:indole-3-glycerol phosphate synthase TrpC n=1 Tax=Anaerosporobacter faecicola TaxID=2718714 RepID=UPI00143C0A08|nr:indole-3-glycerol phosphate synthase TrpC [Anaerosporobacter faecicola]